MQTEFYHIVQKEAERSGTEVSAGTIMGIFRAMYYLGNDHTRRGYIALRSHSAHRISTTGPWRVEAEIECDGASRFIHASGPEPQTALLSALGHHLNVSLQCVATSEHQIDGARTEGRSVASYVQLLHPSTAGTSWGVGVDSDSQSARLQAVISAVNVVIDNMRIRPIRPSRPNTHIREDFPRQRPHAAIGI